MTHPMTPRSLHVRKAALFVGLTYVLSWGFVLVYLGLGGTWTRPGSMVVAVIYMFFPALSAVIVQKGIYREPVARPLGISFRLNRWFLVAWLAPVGIALATLGVGVLLPGVSYAPEMSGFLDRFADVLSPADIEEMRTEVQNAPMDPLLMGVLGGMLAGVTVNAVAAFGEELGWRGLLLRALEPMGFWRVSAVTGLVWGVWHAPLILQGHNYPEHPVAGVLMMVVFTVLLSPLFTLVTLRSGSVLSAAVLHGTLNATGGLAILFVQGGSDLTVGITGLAGAVVLALTTAGVWAWVRHSGTARPT